MSKRMTPEEFQAKGYLQEVNRRFFHPLGLAMAVVTDRHAEHPTWEGSHYLMLDWRDNPACGVMGDGQGGLADDLGPMADAIDTEWEARRPARVAKFGFMVQPRR